ncbi:MAG: prepilin-type N-terminal cleavage/methylation domain-containing protein [Deltaproteobacteria bacterium]|nr:prepilin-type N-terminal cleavage/methylation domain-containing protein [Deltaproteobacteria bacterium]
MNHQLVPFKMKKKEYGFTLLEVMVAMSIIAIALMAMLGSQSQSLSLANEAKFSTTSTLLAKSKIAEIEAEKPENLTSVSGNFGEDFPNYQWDLMVNDVALPGSEEVTDYLKQIDLNISWGVDKQYQYQLRLYRFVPKDR